MCITAEIFSNDGILKKVHGFQRRGRQDAMLGIGPLKKEELQWNDSSPRTGLAGFHMHSSDSVKVALVILLIKGSFILPDSGDMHLTICLLGSMGPK